MNTVSTTKALEAMRAVATDPAMTEMDEIMRELGLGWMIEGDDE